MDRQHGSNPGWLPDDELTREWKQAMKENNLTPNEYMTLALAKEADQGKIRERIFAIGIQATRMDNGLRGLTDEVGELAGAVKGWLEYGRPLDTQDILEECGDVLWRTSQILLAAGYTLEEAMKANLRKLNVRFKGAATDHAEEDRNREAEREALQDK